MTGLIVLLGLALVVGFFLVVIYNRLVRLRVRTQDAWSGIDTPLDGRVVKVDRRWDPAHPATDYDRACEIETIRVAAVPIMASIIIALRIVAPLYGRSSRRSLGG